MEQKRWAAWAAAALIALRLLLPGPARRLGLALREAFSGGAWERVETLGRSVAPSP